MSTVNDLNKQALKILGILRPNQSPDASMSSDGLFIANSIIDLWTLNGALSYAVSTESFALVSGQSSRTIGSGGNFSTTRPIRIVKAFVRTTDNTDIDVDIINYDQYKEIETKSTQATYPTHLYYEPSYPLGTLYFYPVPTSTYSIYLTTHKHFGQFSAISDNVSLPPGYESYLTYEMAIRWASHFGKQVPGDVMATYEKIKSTVESVNRSQNTPQLKTDAPVGWFRNNVNSNISVLY